MKLTRSIVMGTAVLMAAGCTPPPPSPAVMALPGKGKDLAAFQQDDRVCAQYAATQANLPLPTQPSQPAADEVPPGTAPGQPIAPSMAQQQQQQEQLKQPPLPQPTVAQGRIYEISYSQCMVARGDTLQAAPVATNYTPYYPYPSYAYPMVYGYGYPVGAYPYLYGAYYGGWGPGLGWGWGGYWHGGWGGGWRGGWGGGWHGGWGGGGGFRR